MTAVCLAYFLSICSHHLAEGRKIPWFPACVSDGWGSGVSHLSLMISCSNPPHTHTHPASTQVNDTDMKDIRAPSSFPQRSLSSVVRPDSSFPHRHVSTGPQFHQMYALQLQLHCHFSLCVSVFSGTKPTFSWLCRG